MESERDNKRLNAAIRFAVDRHAGQLRKGTNHPYIIHPMEVMSILVRMDADANLLIAGVLHDTVEDTDATIDEIVMLFGEDVGALVANHSEDKSMTWNERKQHAIKELKTADKRLKMLVMADKLSNLRSIAADYHKLGELLWERFNASAEKQSWYYSEVQDALLSLHGCPDTQDMYWEMVALYKDAFVRYYINEHGNRLYQCARHGEVHMLAKEDPIWRPISRITDNEKTITLSLMQAEATEDDWNMQMITQRQINGYLNS